MKKTIAAFLLILALWPLSQIRVRFSGEALGWNLWQIFLILLLVGAARELWKGKKSLSAKKQVATQRLGHDPKKAADEGTAAVPQAKREGDGELLFFNSTGPGPGEMRVRVVRVGMDFFHTLERDDSLDGRSYDPEVTLIDRAEARRLGLEMGYDLDEVASKTK